MIRINGSPADVARLADAYPPNGMERSVFQAMSGSGQDLDFDSEEALRFEVELRAATVNAAVGLFHSGMEFAVFRKSKCNPAYWDRTPEGGFLLKERAAAGEAIRDIYENGRKYATECATAILIVFYKAMLAVYPEPLFNEVFSQIELMDWHRVDPLFRGVAVMSPADSFFSGDRQYFKNPDVNPVTPEWQGENVIVLGGGLYYGHGIGIQNGAVMIRELNRNRVRGATESAYLQQKAGRPDYRKLLRIRTNSYR